MDEIKKIISQDVSNQQKVHKLLEYDCHIHTNLGTESTPTQREEVKTLSQNIINEVVKLDPELKYLQ